MVSSKGGVKSMKKDNILASLWSTVAWLTGVLVSLAVGFGMVNGVLAIPVLSSIAGGVIVKVAGYIVIILALLGVALKLIDRFS